MRLKKSSQAFLAMRWGNFKDLVLPQQIKDALPSKVRSYYLKIYDEAYHFIWQAWGVRLQTALYFFHIDNKSSVLLIATTEVVITCLPMCMYEYKPMVCMLQRCGSSEIKWGFHMVRNNSKGGPMFLLHRFDLLVPCLVSLHLTILLKRKNLSMTSITLFLGFH